MTLPSTSEPSREEIWKMFDAISSTYDQANLLMTGGLDRYWRKKVARFLPKQSQLHLLDCATGTADQILSLCHHSQAIKKAVGIDLSEEMLKIGELKVAKSPFRNKISLQKASALQLPFSSDTFDCVTMSFGIRNVTSISDCLTEMLRVLKPGGRVLILETSVPKSFIIQKLHLFHLRFILPFLGGKISKQKAAYRYLNRTAETFPSGEDFLSFLNKAGFSELSFYPLTFGAVTLYVGDKKV